MEDFGTCYAVIRNHPELRRGLISEAERTRRTGQGARYQSDLAPWLAQTLRWLASSVEPTLPLEPVASQSGSPPSIVAAALGRKTRTIAHVGRFGVKLIRCIVPAAVLLALFTAQVMAGPPSYEPAYFNGQTVTINAIEVPNHAPLRAQADFYQVVYPVGWQQLGLAAPQCNPCDHEGNGVDFTDFHDHVLDSIPASPGHGEFSPLWHVFLVVPAYTGDATHDALVAAAYASRLPAKSEAAVDALLAARLPDGSPVAQEIDTQFYFLCAVVSSNAAR
jgi:hypothetical protein